MDIRLEKKKNMFQSVAEEQELMFSAIELIRFTWTYSTNWD